MQKILSREIRTKANVFLPGTVVTLEFTTVQGWPAIRGIDIFERKFLTLAKNAPETFVGVAKRPSVRTMEKWQNDGYCKTIFGARTEPDGTGPDGEPSWMLAMGLI